MSYTPNDRASAGQTTAETTPPNITILAANEIFVFGSNYAGRHGKGAALVALQKFGAVSGQGTGLMGRSYGIATKGWNLDALPLSKIGEQVSTFFAFARARPDLKFLVTEIGCGLAGYKPEDVAPLFCAVIPGNVILPASFHRQRLPEVYWHGAGCYCDHTRLREDDACPVCDAQPRPEIRTMPHGCRYVPNR
jgi:hypothetical protein